MLTVISPAKKLDLSPLPLPDGLEPTVPVFAAEASALAKVARKLKVADLQALMGISEALGRLNRDRFNAFDKAPEAIKPAALMFDGDTYAGLEAKTLSEDALRYAQGHLRILSGLYGLLRPLDAIQPYRLEMGSRLATRRGENLYDWWGPRIAKALRADAAAMGAEIVLNCASVEYFGAVDLRALKLRVVTPVFLEDRVGGAKTISFLAKRARGAMARYVTEHRLTDPEALRGFTVGGYAFDAGQSTADRMVFVNREAAAAPDQEAAA
ncbi:MAG: peroxide stress protein YaaA [Paracoccaceae bacterium]